MLKVFKKLITSLCFVVLFLFLFATNNSVFAQSATFSLDFPQKQILENEEFTINIFVNTVTASVNTIYIDMMYNSDLLKLISFDFTDTAFPNIAEKNYKTPGFVSVTLFNVNSVRGNSNKVIGLKFKALSEGEATFSILSDSKIHLDDGLGTDILNYAASQKNITFKISNSDTETENSKIFAMAAEKVLKTDQDLKTVNNPEVEDYSESNTSNLLRFYHFLTTQLGEVLTWLLIFIIVLLPFIIIGVVIYLKDKRAN